MLNVGCDFMTACENEGHNSYEYFFYVVKKMFLSGKGGWEEIEKGGRVWNI